ncbi:hypothetical protein BCR36DRAFT_413821 [Piromyces finnis]|uniref:Ribonuclease H n=1 Tax=Piromyces finnis TaxID=1754191 RepID=A0A1Y1V465_9FUNG|nr:hypothetical protein BCR36DRAFT_413821 [Piromyces finnis]|eukprot:ORX46871.1 hypothetical protein BCR36DRAFT_413821 [Piromyces finnis]
MVVKKFYAIKKGYTTGIFKSWKECKRHVLGYKGSVYKGFMTLKEAEDFLNGREVSVKLEDGVKKNMTKPKKSIKKYYAIKRGYKTGVFDTWDECKDYVMGYNGSIYKSFLTLEEAQDFVKGNELSEKMEAGVKIKEKKKTTFDRKFYAVRRGRNTGIFTTWEQCKKQVYGFRYPYYKSFYTLKEARDFLQGNDKEKDNSEDLQENMEIIDVDANSNNTGEENVMEIPENINTHENTENSNTNNIKENTNITSNLENINTHENTENLNTNNATENTNISNNSTNIKVNEISENADLDIIIIDDDDEKSNDNSTSTKLEKKIDIIENTTNSLNIDIKSKIMHDNINNGNQSKAVAYVDGSFNKKTKEYSYGAVIFYQNQGHHFYKKFNDPEMRKMRNVAGEIEGAKRAMSYCIENKIPEIDIYYDYIGIENWATNIWKATKPGTIQYKNYYNQIKKNLKVNFIKVKAHSDNKYNDLADRLAKKALNIRSDSSINIPKQNLYNNRLKNRK